ncbi:MAG TPA: NAD(P)H-dependent oxidoreductase subunit E, partial [Desulfobacterales bacterium]|nr:NAD(P)H-dependent oxidoreductase subunit E [Desulfobacterales bacterium]
MPGSKDSPQDNKAAIAIIESMGEVTANDLIPILQRIQDSYGYLPTEIMTEVSDRTGIPASRIYGVITFYEQ